MKKVTPLVSLLLIILLIFTGCASKEAKAEKEDLNKLESIGFSPTDAQSFYNFSNSIKIVFQQMSNVNNDIENNDFVVPREEYKQVSAAIEVSRNAYNELNPKGIKEYDEYLTDDENKMESPLLILDNIEKNKRGFTIVEAAMMYDMMSYFANLAIKSANISKEKQTEAIKWYHSNNAYSGLFKETYDFRTDNQTNFN